LTAKRGPSDGRGVATVIFGDFEWDDQKAAANLRKHGVGFEEAISALADPRALEAPELGHPGRFVTIGRSALLRVLFVVHAENVAGDRVRIISARRAARGQRRKYEEG
jgi:uncharacterized DUF497 family protein